MKQRRRARSPRLSVLLVILASAGLQCASLSPFSPTAYQYATSLKVEALMLMDKATEPYATHQAAVEALTTKVDIAYEYAKGRPNNDISTRQWESLKDPGRHLLGGFLRRWQAESRLARPFVEEAKGLVSDAFDTIIGLESGKVKAGAVL